MCAHNTSSVRSNIRVMSVLITNKFIYYNLSISTSHHAKTGLEFLVNPDHYRSHHPKNEESMITKAVHHQKLVASCISTHVYSNSLNLVCGGSSMDVQSIIVLFVSFILKYPIAIHWTIVQQISLRCKCMCILGL